MKLRNDPHLTGSEERCKYSGKRKNRDEKVSTVQNVASCKTHIYANVHSVTL